MVSVPSKDNITDAGSSGLSAAAPGVGSMVGRAGFGPLGGGVGGLLGAATLSGEKRTRTSEMVVYSTFNELGQNLFDSRSGGNSGGSRGTM